MAGKRKISGVHLWLVLWKTQKRMEAKAFEHINSMGMCPSDFGTLEILLHKGEMPVNDIGKKILLSSGSITSAVDRVEKMGFVKRKDHPTDRRIKVVSLTSKGRGFIEKAFADHEKEMEKTAYPLSQSERAELTKLLRKLKSGVEEKAKGEKK